MPTFSRDNAEDIKVAVITIAFISRHSRSGSARGIRGGRSVETLIRDGAHGIKFFRSSRAHLVIPAETGDNVSGLGDEQEVVHALQGLADAVAAAVAAFGLARVVRCLLRATLHLQTEASAFQKVRD